MDLDYDEKELRSLEAEKESLQGQYLEIDKRAERLVLVYLECTLLLIALNGGSIYYNGSYAACYGAVFLAVYMVVMFLPIFLTLSYITFGKVEGLNLSIENFLKREEDFLEDLDNHQSPQSRVPQTGQATNTTDEGRGEASDNNQQKSASPPRPDGLRDHQKKLRKYNRRVTSLRRRPWNLTRLGRYSTVVNLIWVAGIIQAFVMPFLLAYALCPNEAMSSSVGAQEFVFRPT